MTDLSKGVCGEILWVWRAKSVLVQFQMQVSCLSLHPALALIRQFRKTAQMKEVIGFALEKYEKPLMMLFSLPSTILPFKLHDALIYLLWFIWLIAFVAKKTFFVLPVPIWLPKDPITTSFLKFD